MAAPEVYHLTNVHSPFDARIFYKQAQTLARAGYAVTVVGPGPEEWNGERAGVRVQTVPVARGTGQRILNLWRLLRVGLGADAACLHFHDPELLPVGAVLKLCGRRVIYDVHEHFPLVAMVRPWAPERLRRPLARSADRGPR
ncbi:MAG: glycosyltransferase, partial [Gemmatimonadetes bacterium]|nr:glycosyltransferase [Gemmatimonadota bacterium]